jgi:hypothetical protein
VTAFGAQLTLSESCLSDGFAPIPAIRIAAMEPVLNAQGRFVAARRIVELRTKRSSVPDGGQAGGWLMPADRGTP